MSSVHSFISNAANRIYLAGLFLVPTIFIVSYTVPIPALKMTIAAVALIGASVLAILYSLKRGSISIPLSFVIGAAWLLPLAYLASALLGPSFMWSLVGSGLDGDTVFFAAMLALSVTVPFAVSDSKADVRMALTVLVAVSGVVALFHLIRLVLGTDLTSFGVMTNPLFTPLGKWTDLAIFFGLMGGMALIALESFTLKGREWYAVLTTLVASVFFVTLVNFTPAWVALGLVALGVLIYKLVLEPKEQSTFSIAATIVFVLATVAVLFAGSIGGSMSRAFGLEHVEARPAWTSTFAIAQGALASNPLTGAGPNLFATQWDLYRPLEVNQSIFWNADFTAGVGLIPTSIVTTGLIGTLAWLLLIGAFLFVGVRGLLSRTAHDPQTYQLMVLTFYGGLYTLAMAVLYLPSPQVAFIGFALIGMYAALQHRASLGPVFSVDFRERPRVGFVAVLGLAFALVASVLTVYGVGVVYAAAQAAEEASRAAQVEGNFDLGLERVRSAVTLNPTDEAFRLAAFIHLAKLNTIIASAGSDTRSQEAFQRELGSAVEAALSAVRMNETNYRNWTTLSATYQAVVPLKVDGSYEAAVNAMVKARTLNPGMPTLPLTLAQLEASQGKTAEARAFLEESIALKRDFIPALNSLAQLELNSGNLDKAIERAEAAALFEPSNAVLQFQAGVLKFEARRYDAALESFLRAVAIAPEYANARFYLGRTYVVKNQYELAIPEFVEVQRLNPDNEEVAGIITGLRAGKNPFAPRR